MSRHTENQRTHKWEKEMELIWASIRQITVCLWIILGLYYVSVIITARWWFSWLKPTSFNRLQRIAHFARHKWQHIRLNGRTIIVTSPHKVPHNYRSHVFVWWILMRIGLRKVPMDSFDDARYIFMYYFVRWVPGLRAATWTPEKKTRYDWQVPFVSRLLSQLSAFCPWVKKYYHKKLSVEFRRGWISADDAKCSFSASTSNR